VYGLKNVTGEKKLYLWEE